MTTNKDDAYKLYKLGTELLEAGDPAQAALLLERAKSAEPNKGSICEALGRAYYNYGRFDPARNNFEESIRIDPVNHYAHFGLALCLERLGEYDRALGHIKLALAMSPKNENYKRAGERLRRLRAG